MFYLDFVDSPLIVLRSLPVEINSISGNLHRNGLSHYTFVKMENECLKESLFRPGELMEGPETRALVFLPLEGSPEPSVILMLERMLEAMKFTPGEWRYIYHNGNLDWRLVNEEEVCILFFASSNAQNVKPERRNEAQGSWYMLPSLGQINADYALKRAVWDLIKP